MTEGPSAIAVIMERARVRLKELGPVAEAAVEELRQELERTPRLGVLRGAAPSPRGEAYKTRIEPRPGMPALTVAYLYIPQPPPPAVAIALVVPEEPFAD